MAGETPETVQLEGLEAQHAALVRDRVSAMRAEASFVEQSGWSRIAKAVAKRKGLDPERVMVIVDRSQGLATGYQVISPEELERIKKASEPKVEG